jgi:hypothetical protein
MPAVFCLTLPGTTPDSRKGDAQSFSSSTILMALVGHSSAQMPHPLQYSKSISTGMERLTTASGQYSQQMKQDARLFLKGVHRE